MGKIREKYEKNTRALGKTRGRGPPVSFFLELSYFSRIFAGAGPQPKYEKNTGKIREKYESSRKNERARAARLVFPRALVFFSYFCRCGPAAKIRKIRDKYGKKYEKNTRARGKTRGRGPPVSFFLELSYFSRIFAGAGPQPKYEKNTGQIRKNTRARGKTRGRGPPVSFFLELSYFSRIFAGAGPQPKYEKNTGKIREKYESSRIFLVFLPVRARSQNTRKIREKYGKNTGKIREKYESSRKNERARAARLVFPRALVFFSYFCWGRARSQKYEKNTGQIRKKIREKYESSRKNERARAARLVFPRALVFFSYFSCIFPVFFSYCPLLLDCLSYFLLYSLSYFSRILFVF